MKSLLSIVCVVSAVALGVWAFANRGGRVEHTVAAAGGQSELSAPADGARVSLANVATSAKTGAPQDATVNERTADRLRTRALTRWTVVARGDWIDAYTYLTPEQQRGVTVAQFLSGKNFHTYASPSVDRIVAVEDSYGYVATRALWTPQHPDLQRVKLEPGQSLTEELHMIETWRWAGDDWYFVEAAREGEFFAAHPALAGR